MERECRGEARALKYFKIFGGLSHFQWLKEKPAKGKVILDGQKTDENNMLFLAATKKLPKITLFLAAFTQPPKIVLLLTASS